MKNNFNLIFGSLSVFLLLLLISSDIRSQTVFLKANGEMLIRFPDGTEREVVPSDSILYRTAFDDIIDIVEEEEVNIDKPNLIPPQKNDLIIHTSIAIRQTKNLLDLYTDSIRTLNTEKVDLEEQLEYARNNPGRIRPSERIELSSRYDFVIDKINTAESKVRSLKRELAQIQRREHIYILKKLPLTRVITFHNQYFFDELDPMDAPGATLPKSTEAAAEPIPWAPPEDIPMPIIPHPSSVPDAGLMKTHPERKCDFILKSNEVDSDNPKIKTTPEQLTFYLPQEMRVHRRGRPMITIYASVEFSERGKFLVMDIELKIPSARVSMGGMRKDSPVRIQLLDGQIINLRNLTEDTGTFNQPDNKVSYTAVMPLSEKNVAQLRSGEADLLRLVWDSGYADYEIYDINLLRDHLDCIYKQQNKHH